MSVDRQEFQSAVWQERSDEVLAVTGSVPDSWIAPRVIALTVAALIFIAFVAVLFVLPR